MQSVAPTRSLNRRSRDMLIAAALVFLLGASLAVAGVALHIFRLVVPFNPGFAVYDLTRKALLALGLAVALVSMLMALRAVTWRTDNKNARRLAEDLEARLDHQFVFIRNISMRPIGYVDAALVSKHGVLVLRISNRKGEFFNEGGQWLKRRRQGKWRPLRWNPTREVVANAVKVKAHLKDYDLQEIPVFAAIVFLRDAPAVTLKLRQPAVPVFHASRLIEELRDSYFAEARIHAEAVQAAANLLYH